MTRWNWWSLLLKIISWDSICYEDLSFDILFVILIRTHLFVCSFTLVAKVFSAFFCEYTILNDKVLISVPVCL